MFTDLDWSEAACKGESLSLFFSHNAKRIEEAKAFCAVCPIRLQCLNWALDREEHGVWGGLSLRERLQLIADTNDC